MGVQTTHYPTRNQCLAGKNRRELPPRPGKQHDLAAKVAWRGMHGVIPVTPRQGDIWKRLNRAPLLFLRRASKSWPRSFVSRTLTPTLYNGFVSSSRRISQPFREMLAPLLFATARSKVRTSASLWVIVVSKWLSATILISSLHATARPAWRIVRKGCCTATRPR